MDESTSRCRCIACNCKFVGLRHLLRIGCGHTTVANDSSAIQLASISRNHPGVRCQPVDHVAANASLGGCRRILDTVTLAAATCDRKANQNWAYKDEDVAAGDNPKYLPVVSQTCRMTNHPMGITFAFCLLPFAEWSNLKCQ